MGSHIHLGVRNLKSTLAWLDRVWRSKPVYQDKQMAVVPFGSLTMIFDVAKKDSPATLAYSSRNCNADFKIALERGAKSVDPPTDRAYGVRSAYLQGPGAITFEIEEPLRGRKRR